MTGADPALARYVLGEMTFREFWDALKASGDARVDFFEFLDPHPGVFPNVRYFPNSFQERRQHLVVHAPDMKTFVFSIKIRWEEKFRPAREGLLFEDSDTRALVGFCGDPFRSETTR